MVDKRRTRKYRNKKTENGIFTIPELRRSFEHIEGFLHRKLKSKASKSEIVKDLQKEWKRVFLRDLDHNSAEAYVEHVMHHSHSHSHSHKRRGTLKSTRGGAAPIAGAPLDYTTRAGIYTQPAAIPPAAYGNILEYVSKGFWNPEQAHQYDPVPGQTRYVTSTPVGMGDNTFMKGGQRGKKDKRGGTRKLRRGGGLAALIDQGITKMVSSTSPPGIIQDMQDMWKGKTVGPSPDFTQVKPNYYLGNVAPKSVDIRFT
jgi:hypothetical protein